MPEPLLEQVFKLSGIPSYTFVPPLEYDKLLVAVRTPGRGVVIEGPSGIGKTTAVSQALTELGMDDSVLRLSARKADDRSVIEELPRGLPPLWLTPDLRDFRSLGERSRHDAKGLPQGIP